MKHIEAPPLSKSTELLFSSFLTTPQSARPRLPSVPLQLHLANTRRLATLYEHGSCEQNCHLNSSLISIKPYSMSHPTLMETCDIARHSSVFREGTPGTPLLVLFSHPLSSVPFQTAAWSAESCANEAQRIHQG